MKWKNTVSINNQVDAIWSDLHQELLRFIAQKVKDTELAKDLLQDVFLKIQQSLHTLRDPSRLTAWVYQITRNVIADHYRKTQNEISLSGFELPGQDDEEPLYVSLSHCINQKISRLPDKYRQAILLTYFGNRSQLALAEKWRVSYTGAKSRVQRGRDKLKALILRCKNLQSDSTGKPTGYQKSKK